MPNRAYRGKEPPTVLDHFLANPFEVLISAGTLIACALIALYELGVPIVLSEDVEVLPPLVAWIIVLTGLGGNALIISGLLDPGSDLHRGWRLERLGIVGTVTAWGTFTTSLVMQQPGSVVGYILPMLLVGAYIVRFVATVREDQRVRASIRSSLPPGVQT